MLLMQTIVYWDFVCSCCGHEFFEVRYCVGFSHACGEQGVEFSLWVQEVIVGIDEDNGCVGWHFEVLNWLVCKVW